MLNVALGLAAATAVVGQTSLARADDVNVGVLFFSQGSFTGKGTLPVSVSENGVEPDPLKDKHLRYEGESKMIGGGLQVNVYGPVLRGGFAAWVFGFDGARLRHDALDNKFSITGEGAWGAGLDVFVGRELFRGPVYPYIDMKATFAATAVDIDLRHPEFGRVGRSVYEGWSFGLGPRVGMAIPITGPLFIDASAYYGLLGMERYSFTGGLGFWSR